MSTLYTTQVPSPTATDIFENQVLTVATTVVFSTAGSISGGRFYGPVTVDVGTFELALWKALTADTANGQGTGQLLATAMFSAAIPGVWNSASFGTPVSVLPNVAYRIGVRSSLGRYAAILNGFQSSGITNEGVSAPQTETNPTGIGALFNGAFVSSLTAYPNQTFNGHAYLVDPIFVPGSEVNPAVASSFMSFF